MRNRVGVLPVEPVLPDHSAKQGPYIVELSFTRKGFNDRAGYGAIIDLTGFN